MIFFCIVEELDHNHLIGRHLDHVQSDAWDPIQNVRESPLSTFDPQWEIINTM